jgi:uncharacterized protein
MAISLYDVSIASYLQVLGGVAGFLAKGRAYCLENDIDLIDVVESRLHPDMLPFRFQVVSVAHHSLGALDGIRSGTFQPPTMQPDLDYAGLERLVTDARDALKQVPADDVDALVGRDVVFRLGEVSLPFTAEHFVLSFSLPNLYFHAATAYDILRSRGVPLGKRDFMGAVRLKR